MIPEREREALMRLTMCARDECTMCKYKWQGFSKCYELATKCMNILADALNTDRKTEPQANADQHVQRVEYVGNDEKSRCWTCKHFERMHETPIASDGNYYTYVVCTAKECHYEPKDEPQTEIKIEPTWVGTTYGRFDDEPQVVEKCDRPQMDCENCWRQLHCRVKDEPQTDGEPWTKGGRHAYAHEEIYPRGSEVQN